MRELRELCGVERAECSVELRELIELCRVERADRAR